ncbi:MAG TPA: helix-turn-helix transcriptional regulator [Pyrinomonadaceae bacterium]|jgi:transcriptional regulator with XRE-family HTH domain|nr:helix-turn-helix transcriptional regulator [Pyrinomonadaceae bacterium]
MNYAFQIRTALGLSQNELIQRLSLEDELVRAQISDFERGRRVPALPVILEYSRVAGVYMDALVDDQLDIPGMLPCSPKHAGISRRASRKTGGRS